jgi:hypothetical protein
MLDKQALLGKLVQRVEKAEENLQKQQNINFLKNLLFYTAIGTTVGTGMAILPSFFRKQFQGKNSLSGLTSDTESSVLSDIMAGKTLPKTHHITQSWKEEENDSGDDDNDDEEEKDKKLSSKTSLKVVNTGNPFMSFHKSSSDKKHIEKSAKSQNEGISLHKTLNYISGDPVLSYPTYFLAGALGLYLGKEFGKNFLRKVEKEEQSAIQEEVRERYRKELKEVLELIDENKNLKLGEDIENNLEKKGFIFDIINKTTSGTIKGHEILRYTVPGLLAGWIFYRTINKLKEEKEKPIKDLVDKINLQRDYSVDSIPEDVDIVLSEYRKEKKKRKNKNLEDIDDYE